jgi:hypothetical protein
MASPRDHRLLLEFCGDADQYLLNNPHQNLNHRATAKLVSKLTGLPYAVLEPDPIKAAIN